MPACSRTAKAKLVLGVALGLLLRPAPARAGPPLISDDPYTLGRGRVEAIAAVSSAGQPGSELVAAPVLDLTLGVVDGLDLTLVAQPDFVLESSDGPYRTGSVVGGFKWQPVADRHLAVSVTPAIGADVLSAENFFVTLPVQIEYSIGLGAIGVDGGYTWVRDDVDGWNASLYGAYQLSPAVLLLAELWALNAPVLGGSDFGGGLGLDWMWRDGFSLLAMAGTGIASEDSARVEWVGYLGVRWAFRAFGAERAAPPAVTPPVPPVPQRRRSPADASRPLSRIAELPERIVVLPERVAESARITGSIRGLRVGIVTASARRGEAEDSPLVVSLTLELTSTAQRPLLLFPLATLGASGGALAPLAVEDLAGGGAWPLLLAPGEIRRLELGSHDAAPRPIGSRVDLGVELREASGEAVAIRLNGIPVRPAAAR